MSMKKNIKPPVPTPIDLLKHCFQCKYYNEFGMCTYSFSHDVRDIVTGQYARFPVDPITVRAREAYCGSKGTWYIKKENKN